LVIGEGYADWDDACGILRQLTVEAPTQMESLTLKGESLSSEVNEALATFVKSAVWLKKLSLDLSDDLDENFRTILEEALQENGSLVLACEGLTDLYCCRNANLRLLLEQQPMSLAVLSLIPSLFHAAKAAKRMAANIIYARVLMGFEHLGGKGQGPNTRP
jgi:hypothetical protein